MLTRPGAITYFPPGAPATGGPSGPVDTGIQSLADLAAVSTVALAVPCSRIWISSADGSIQVWELVASTAATGPGVQQPNDFNSSTNAKCWFKAG